MTLREVADRESVRAQRSFSLGAAHAGLQDGRLRFGVDGDQRVEPTRVDADHRGEPAAHRVDTADDAGAATEGYDRDAPFGADGEQTAHLGGIGGEHHRIGGVAAIAGSHPVQVGIAFAAAVLEPREAFGIDVLGTDDCAQRIQIGCAQGDVGQRHALDVHRWRVHRRRFDATQLAQRGPRRTG